jgi:hypothetical protein
MAEAQFSAPLALPALSVHLQNRIGGKSLHSPKWTWQVYISGRNRNLGVLA